MCRVALILSIIVSFEYETPKKRLTAACQTPGWYEIEPVWTTKRPNYFWVSFLSSIHLVNWDIMRMFGDKWACAAWKHFLTLTCQEYSAPAGVSALDCNMRPLALLLLTHNPGLYGLLYFCIEGGLTFISDLENNRIITWFLSFAPFAACII